MAGSRKKKPFLQRNRKRRNKGIAAAGQRAWWLQAARYLLEKWRWVLAVLSPILLLGLLILLFRWLPIPTSAFMIADTTDDIDYLWVPMERIAPSAALAVVAAEDQLFPKHHGFDFRSILNAARTNRDRARPRGASTITQQTAKNLFLWSGGGMFRKAMEAWIALNLELLWGKRRILEVYLNIAEMGRGVYGVEAASRRFFGVPAAHLRPWQAARLAAVLPSPKRYSAQNPSASVRAKADWIERQMKNLGAGYLKRL